jgi:hypothetical protein
VKRQPGALTLSEDDRRVLAVRAADCAERTLSLFEAQAPNDTRPRDAIDGLRAFARGDMRRRGPVALSHAAPIVRDVLRRYRPRPAPAGMLGALISDMHTKLTRGG